MLLKAVSIVHGNSKMKSRITFKANDYECDSDRLKLSDMKNKLFNRREKCTYYAIIGQECIKYFQKPNIIFSLNCTSLFSSEM